MSDQNGSQQVLLGQLVTQLSNINANIQFVVEEMRKANEYRRKREDREAQRYGN
jgi:hypothetical protein